MPVHASHGTLTVVVEVVPAPIAVTLPVDRRVDQRRAASRRCGVIATVYVPASRPMNVAWLSPQSTTCELPDARAVGRVDLHLHRAEVGARVHRERASSG